MLNVSPFFQLAIDAMDGPRSPEVKLAPLVVLAAQQDFLNHLSYAANHYLTVPLTAPFLQKSSIGTPYQKWAKFTNEDFNLLDYSFWLLLQSTSRLWHEVHMRYPLDRAVLAADHDAYQKIKQTSNRFTNLVCARKFNDCRVGLTILENESIEVDSLSWDSGYPVATKSSLSVKNRNGLVDVRYQLMSELGALTELHEQFATCCKRFCATNDIYAKHDLIHESYWTPFL